MSVLHLIAEVAVRVPAGAAVGTRWRAEARVQTPHGAHEIAIAARIDPGGQRREQCFCDGVRVERAVLLRLTCPEGECPHVRLVRSQWDAFRGRTPAPPRPARPQALPLIADVPVAVAGHHCSARPARFPCHTPCPHACHPPLTIDKAGYDLFEDGLCLGGGWVESDGVRRPRLPTIGAAEAFVLARHLEAVAALEEVRSRA